MCGIVAIIGPSAKKQEPLVNSLEKISHRGDFQNENKTFEKVALGANRLAIVDEVHGKQPLTDETETVFVIQNGEIFNYKVLTPELEQKGHVFKTRSDTEVLTHLWEEYREGMVEKIDSEMFAFVLYDKQNETVFAARDRFGVKPLFYGTDSTGSTIFASEMKALVVTCEKIQEFPPAHYFLNGEFVRYYLPSTKTLDVPLAEAQAEFSRLIEEAVAKRVDTVLPIAVFLSGGVDSSLVMELATRHHKNVTALILGFSDSPDYVAAVRLCDERGWSYKVIEPNIDYVKELEQIIYYLESYDPNVVRHSFANNVISKLARDLGFKVVLTGEGSDELFAGYNEFLQLNPSKINEGCRLLLDSMPHGNLARVDRLAMRHTVETRCPFFDTAVVDFALSLPDSLKVGGHAGVRTTKLLVRQAAARILPDYIAYREKVAFANGAGMGVGLNYRNADGLLSGIAEQRVSNEELNLYQANYPDYQLQTKEEVLYFSIYERFGYTKFVDGSKRLLVKDTLASL